MNRSLAAQRGVTLIVMLISIVVATLLVVGAIAFTGSDCAASGLQARGERLSGCVMAARNLFLAQVRVLQGNVEDVSLDAGISISDVDGGMLFLQTRHYTGSVALKTVNRLADNSIGVAGRKVSDQTNFIGSSTLKAGYWSITATCQENDAGPEQEVEFVVRVGL